MANTFAVMTPSALIRRRPPFAREVALAVVAYAVYEAARWLAAGSYPLALEHAQQVVALERDLHVDAEGAVQRVFLNSPLLPVLNYVYLAAQDLVLPAALVLVYRLHRPTYRTLRNTLLATWGLALPVYALFPTAPPRLAGLGIVDTVSAGGPMKLDSGAATALANQFAAVPSLHVGFAFAIGIALTTVLQAPILRVVAALWGPLVLLTVVATGNHFVFDALAGLAITAAGYAVSRAAAKVRRPATRRASVCALGALGPLEEPSPA